MTMRGKKILITGGAKRIGRAMALHFAEQGAIIILHYNSSKSDADNVKALIENNGGEAHLVQADLQNTSCIEKLFRSIQKMSGGIDVLINSETNFALVMFQG